MTPITVEQADELVAASQYEPKLDGDFEVTETGFVYGLQDGSAVVVSFAGKVRHVK